MIVPLSTPDGAELLPREALVGSAQNQPLPQASMDKFQGERGKPNKNEGFCYAGPSKWALIRSSVANTT
jgi:hypothetical protein